MASIRGLMNLQQKIKRLIDESQSNDDASNLICVMLHHELELDEDIWFEEAELELLFENSADPKVQDAHNELWDRVEFILAGR
jgi:hypothetical protein